MTTSDGSSPSSRFSSPRSAARADIRSKAAPAASFSGPSFVRKY
jgi:hypothetical protein